MPQESVNTNLSSDQQSSDTGKTIPFNFDTSEADAILGGADVNSQAQTVPQNQEQQQVSQESTGQQNAQFTPEQIATLRQQLQVNQQHQQVQQESTADAINYSEQFIAANNKYKEQTGLDFGQMLDDYMMATVGMPLKDTIETVQGMSSYINQRQQADVIEQSTSELRNEWGQNFQTYMDIARAEFDKLPQQTAQQLQFKQSLNNSQGAKLLLAQALQNQGAGTAVARTPVQYNPFTSPSPASSITSGNTPELSLTQILSMPDAQYNSSQIQQALAMGKGVGYIDDINIPQQMTPMQGVHNGQVVQPQQMMLGY